MIRSLLQRVQADSILGPALHGQWLPSQRRFIQDRGAIDHYPVDRHRLPGSHQQGSAGTILPRDAVASCPASYWVAIRGTRDSKAVISRLTRLGERFERLPCGEHDLDHPGGDVLSQEKRSPDR